MDNQIRIKYKGNIVATLNSYTPLLDELVKFIIETKNIVLDEIKCECDEDNFDCSYFEQAIKDVVVDELDKLKIDEESYNQAISKVKNI